MKRTLFLAFFWFALHHAHAAVVPTTGCAPTAEAAVARMIDVTAPSSGTDGYRVETVHHDRLRDRSWALVASCTEPARPRVAVLLPKGMAASTVHGFVRTAPVIHTGDRVTIVSRTGDSVMQLLGWAEEPGAENQQIRVRLTLALDSEHPARTLRCAVVKAGVVEVVR